MWISSLFLSTLADWLISSKRMSITSTRKLLNTVGQFGPAICLAVVSYTGCNRVLTLFLLTIGISLNGGIYSGFKVSVLPESKLRDDVIIFLFQINHLDISPRFAGILMAISNCSAK